MQKKKRYNFVIITILLWAFSTLPITAKVPDIGSISIELTDGDIGTSKENVVFEYAKVAEVVDGQYQMLKEYAEFDLNTIKYADELDEMAKRMTTKVIADGQVKTDDEGKAVISDLEIGVYLLRVSDQARYEIVTPTLIAIPTWDEEVGDMKYDIHVFPKHEPNPPGEIITFTPNGENFGVQTGDATIYRPYIIAFIGSLLLVGYVAYKRKKGGKDDEI